MAFRFTSLALTVQKLVFFPFLKPCTILGGWREGVESYIIIFVLFHTTTLVKKSSKSYTPTELIEKNVRPEVSDANRNSTPLLNMPRQD